MIPYYATTDYARTEALSNRDKWGKPDSKELHDWYTKGFTPVYRSRCASCHGDIPAHEFGFDRGAMWSWIDLSRPEWSPALTAHLAKTAGGRGIPAKGFQFKDVTDPDFQAMLKAVAEGSKKAREVPEADMPGFVNRSQDRSYRYR
jgi:mono/diheme cytochrome c family protein